MAEIDQLKYRLAGARRQLMAVGAEKAEVTDGLCSMVSENLRSNEILQLTQMLAGKANTALVYSPQQDTNGKLCIISTEKDTNKLGRHISATLGGKGGGKPGTYQGFVEKETDADMLSALVKSFQ